MGISGRYVRCYTRYRRTQQPQASDPLADSKSPLQHACDNLHLVKLLRGGKNKTEGLKQLKESIAVYECIAIEEVGTIMHEVGIASVLLEAN